MDSDPQSVKPQEAGSEAVAGASQPEFTATDYSGRVVGGYQLVRLIAEGGMGVVYEAVQINLSRKVAVKILSEELAGRPEFVQRFQREAKAAAALNHPHMVQVHDFCQVGGLCCLVMEFVEGQDLSAYCDQHGKFEIHQALGLVEQAATALKVASEKGIIHRDVKPSNLMLTRDGTVKVSDLGLAKITTEASDLTLTGMAMGSPYFIAPEQANDAGDVDHRADIYSLGLTLLFLLTGKRPFEGNTPFSIVLAQATKPLPRGVELGTTLPDEVERLVHKMAAKKPEERYADYDALLSDLRRVKAGYAPAVDFGAWQRKLLSPKTLIAAGFATILLVSGVLILIFARQRHQVVTQNAGPTAAAPTLREPPVGERRFAERPRGDAFAEMPPDEGPPDEDPNRFESPAGGSGSRLPLPFGRLPPPGSIPPRDTPEAMLAEADGYAAAHPQSYRDLVDRYRAIVSKARGTPIGTQASEKLNSTIQSHQAALRTAMNDYETRMDEALRSKGPEAAYDVWKDFPVNIRTLQSDQQVQQILQQKLPPDFRPERGRQP